MSTAMSDSKPRRLACPLCDKPVSADYPPFCGQGCRDKDLINWLGDTYRVAGPPVETAPPTTDADGLDSEGEAPL